MLNPWGTWEEVLAAQPLEVTIHGVEPHKWWQRGLRVVEMKDVGLTQTTEYRDFSRTHNEVLGTVRSYLSSEYDVTVEMAKEVELTMVWRVTPHSALWKEDTTRG